MQCETCQKSFKTKQGLKYHRDHTVCTVRVPKCPGCQYVFASLQALKYHREHKVCAWRRKRSDLSCPKCNKIFSRVQRLDYHLENGVCEKESRVCSLCQMTFPTVARRQNHMEKKLCLCNQCGGGFKDLMAHQKECGRYTKEYDLSDLTCYECGDLLFRCVHNEEHISLLTERKKEIDAKFDRPFYFDDKVPWERQDYWTEKCPDCGAAREDDIHIFRCLW